MSSLASSACFFQYSIGDAWYEPPEEGRVCCFILSILHWRCSGCVTYVESEYFAAFNTPLEMLNALGPATNATITKHFQYSIGDAECAIERNGVRPKHLAFNTPLEMLGVLVFGFCGFLSFCVGVCGFLAGAC